MVRFSLSPVKTSHAGVNSSFSPYRDGKGDTSGYYSTSTDDSGDDSLSKADDDDDELFVDTDDDDDGEGEPPHPLGFGVTRFGWFSSNSTSYSYRTPTSNETTSSFKSPTRFRWEDSDEEDSNDEPDGYAEYKSNAMNRGDFVSPYSDKKITPYRSIHRAVGHPIAHSSWHEQSYPPIESFTSSYTAPIEALVKYERQDQYNHKKSSQYNNNYNNNDDDGVDKLTQLLHAASIVDPNTVYPRKLQQQQNIENDPGRRMWELNRTVSIHLEQIKKEAKEEKMRLHQENKDAVKGLQMLLNQTLKDAEKIERKEQDLMKAQQQKQEEQRLEREALEKEKQQEQQQKEDRAKAQQEEQQRQQQQKEEQIKAQQRKEQEAKLKKTEYVTKAKKLVTKLVELRESVKPFESSKSPHVKKRRFQMKKTVAGKINTLSHDVQKIKSVAEDVNKVIMEARSHDEHIKQQIQSGNSEFTSDMARGKRYLLDLLASNVMVRIQAESFNGTRGDGFPLAAMLAEVSTQAKELVSILAAHIYTKCPTAIPTLPHPSPDASETEVMESLGMSKNESTGEYETFERFLSRTEGLVSIVANIMASKPENHSLLGGHKGAVDWLERFLGTLPPQQKPLPLLTAPVLVSFLTGTGHMLSHKYPDQFRNHLTKIMDDIVHRLDEGTIGQPSATRLKKLLEDGFNGFQSKVPDGAVPDLYDGGAITEQVAVEAAAAKAAAVEAVAAAAAEKSGGGTYNNPTGRGGKQICRFYANGNCRHGDNCKFSHDLSGGDGGMKNNTNNSDNVSHTNSHLHNPFNSGPSGTPTQQQSQPFGRSSSSISTNSQSGGFGNSTNSTTGTNPFGGGGGGNGGGGEPHKNAVIATPSNPFGGGGSSGNDNMSSTPFGQSNPNNSFGGGGDIGSGISNASPFFGQSTNTNPSPFGGGNGGGQFNNNSGGNTTTNSTSPFGGAGNASTSPFGGTSHAHQQQPFGGGSGGGGGGTSQATPFGNTAQSQPSTPFGGGNGNGSKKGPCKFFLQGTCRNGANCKFSHDTGGGGGGTNNGPSQSNSFGGNSGFGGNTNTPSNPFGGGGGGFGGNNQSTPFGGGGGFGGGGNSSQSNPFGGGGDNRPKCRFFAQGTCRHGNNCKFSHQA